MLLDNHGRQTTYLRLAVTDRCNLRCRYCMPEEGIEFAKRQELLTFEEIIFLCEVLSDLGVNKVRLTGGEPLSRKSLPQLVKSLGNIFPKMAMTTNGILLPPVLDELVGYGLNHYNLSLDTLREDRFFEITRRDDFAGTKRALDELLAKGIKTKINVVVLKGTNDDELGDFVALTQENKVDIRFIEAMPFNDDDGNHHLYLSHQEMLGRIQERFPNIERFSDEANSSSVAYRVPGFKGQVGIIPAFSRSLCGSCNRLRLTPKGTMLNCLYSTKGLELLPLLRSGIGREDLADLITEFVKGKHKTGHDTQRLEQQGSVFASMTSIGG
ncbi:GTP 3',8-cyclase MoaA [Neolewinella persica]|uniref:GTP 3',8-cyclase MoaA n=1 Tax=Neolewinella persica TaxID=70998 RepID=UPI0003722182|nr:GTP 3',8-cyclase MoaA [Neolewinella persica]